MARDSRGFEAPQSHELKAVADEIRRTIDIEDFEEAVLKMMGSILLAMHMHGREVQRILLWQRAWTFSSLILLGLILLVAFR